MSTRTQLQRLRFRSRASRLAFRRLPLAAPLLALAALFVGGCAGSQAPATGIATLFSGPAALETGIAEQPESGVEHPREPDDETALSASPIEPEEPILALPTTGHLALADDTARFRRTFGVAPRLMTPWDVTLTQVELGGAQLSVVGRYSDLEVGPGPEITRSVQQRALVFALRRNPEDEEER